MLRTVEATRYVTPLREGGSLPGIVEAEDLGTYVMKFRGAGQGLKALVAEVIVAELGRVIGLNIPELVVIELDPAIGAREPDPEVQDLLQASAGTNLGVDFLPGSLGYDGISWQPDPQTAARVLWLDAFTVNVDRSWRNPNLLVWHRRLWCIDHGAALTFQHAWPDPSVTSARPYDFGDHVLGAFTNHLREADADIGRLIDKAAIEDAVATVPDGWLTEPDDGAKYVEHLTGRLEARNWVPR
jgi:hypothetical protein